MPQVINSGREKGSVTSTPTDREKSRARDLVLEDGKAPGTELLGRSSSISLARLDQALTIQQASEGFFWQFGGSSAELCGRTFSDLVHPSVQQPLMRQFSGLIEGRRDRFATDVIAVGRDDATFTVPLTALMVRGGLPDESSILVMMPGAEAESADSEVVSGRSKKLLSPIDARILEGIASGLSTIPLASRLHLSRQGIEYHVTCLLRKLRVPNRAALVSRAYSMGVLKVGVWPPKVVQDFIKD
ncbi:MULTISPECIES: LuxR C-terminal-related transcriptional regulator [Streptomyces]|uniref:LuxR C-terminal-related transcriptional regulator n=1 Tax=Streptomyces TaxID=1883 RepID=UPI0013694700|nr:LuxR C-terminal-related transcriptional regulator [Streptomyces sp. SID2888]MYV46287.1 PAS domain-containing protein [Streptomyces sp. SID2888]